MRTEEDELVAPLRRAAPVDDLVASVLRARVHARLLGGGPTPPVRVGRYELIEPIGSGAMGTVFAARDPELDRKVALKVLARDTASVDRVLREARALAQLTHPNVVAVYEVELDGDEIYLTMELVEGQTLRHWLADPAGRDRRAIAAVLVQAGAGLIAAHASGIVHGDLKPDNILVGEDGRVRVADFGLARSPAEQGPTGGTPAYMAPEVRAGQPGTEASDQFSFAVTAYEALVGARPGAPPPSRRARPVPRRIRRALQRAMDPDPGRRFAALDELIAELRVRRPHPGRWLLAQFAVAVIAVGLIAMSGAPAQRCGAGPSRLAAVWNPAARDRVRAAFRATGLPYATAASAATTAAVDQRGATWVAAYHDACEAHARGEQSDTLLDRRMQCLDLRAAELGALVRQLQRADGDAVIASLPAVRALPGVAACADVEALGRAILLPDDATLRAEVEAGLARIDDASALYGLGRDREANDLAAQIAETARRSPVAGLRGRALFLYGRTQIAMGQFAAAQTALLDALDAAGESGDRELSARIWPPLLAAALGQRRMDDVIGWSRFALAAAAGLPEERAAVLGQIGRAHLERAEYADALDHFQQALALFRAADGDDGEAVSKVQVDLGNVYNLMGRDHDAEVIYQVALDSRRRVLGAYYPELATYLGNLGTIALHTGRPAEAERLYRQALAIVDAAYGGDHPAVATALLHLGGALFDQGHYDDAEPYLTRGMTIDVRAFGADDWRIADWVSSLGNIELVRGHYAAAREDFERALAIQRATDPAHPALALALSSIAIAYQSEGKLSAALASYAEARAILVHAYGDDHPDIDQLDANVGEVLLDQHADRAAIAQFDRTVTRTEHAADRSPALVAQALTGLGRGLIGAGSPGRAVAPLERALALGDDAQDPDSLATTRFALATALWTTGRDRARAIGLARDARTALADSEDVTTAGELAEVESWLRAHR